MSCIIKKQELDAAFKIASAITKPKTTYGEWFMLDKGAFISQGLSTRVECPLPTSDLNGTKLLLHEKTIRDLLPNLDEELSFTEKKAGLELKAGKFRSKLITFDPTYYPGKMDCKEGDKIALPLEELQAAIKDVEFAIADDVDRSAKAAFTGVTLKGQGMNVEVIGASDHTIAIAKLHLAGWVRVEPVPDFIFTMPREMGTVISRLSGEVVEIGGLAEQYRTLHAGGVDITTSLIVAKLPNLTPVLERARPVKVTFSREDLKKAIRLAQVFRDKTSNLVTLKIDGDSMFVSAVSQTAGQGQTILPVKLEGKHVTIGGNMNCISSILDKIDADEVTMEVGEQCEQIAFQTTNRLFVTIASAPDKDWE